MFSRSWSGGQVPRVGDSALTRAQVVAQKNEPAYMAGAGRDAANTGNCVCYCSEGKSHIWHHRRRHRGRWLQVREGLAAPGQDVQRLQNRGCAQPRTIAAWSEARATVRDRPQQLSRKFPCRHSGTHWDAVRQALKFAQALDRALTRGIGAGEDRNMQPAGKQPQQPIQRDHVQHSSGRSRVPSTNSQIKEFHIAAVTLCVRVHRGCGAVDGCCWFGSLDIGPQPSYVSLLTHARARTDNSDYGEDDLISDAHPVAISQYTYSIAMQMQVSDVYCYGRYGHHAWTSGNPKLTEVVPLACKYEYACRPRPGR